MLKRIFYISLPTHAKKVSLKKLKNTLKKTLIKYAEYEIFFQLSKKNYFYFLTLNNIQVFY